MIKNETEFVNEFRFCYYITNGFRFIRSAHMNDHRYFVFSKNEWRISLIVPEMTTNNEFR